MRFIKKINNKGISIIELLVCFVIVAVISITLLNTVMEYKSEEQAESVRSHVESYKNTVSRVIQSDITDNGLIGHDEIKYIPTSNNVTLYVDLIFSKPFGDGSTSKRLTVYKSDDDDYILYPDIVKSESGSGYTRQDVKYSLESTSTILDTDLKDSSKKKEYRDLTFPYLNRSMIKVDDGNILYINIPIEHNELDNEKHNYNISIVAPLALITNPDEDASNEGTLVFVSGSGATVCDPKTITKTVGQKWGTLCVPTKDGNDFLGWKTGDECTGKVITSDTLAGKGRLYVYACWNPKTYRLTYTGTQANTCNPTYKEKKHGEKWDTLCIPTKPTGYTFAGWYNGTTKITASTKATATINVTSKFDPDVYKITLNRNGGSGGTSEIYEKYNTSYCTTSGCTATMTKITVPTRTGYAFAGYTSSTGTQVIDSSGNIKTDTKYFTAASTITAQWTANGYSLAYTLDGGTHGSSHPDTATFNEEFTVNNPTKAVKLTFVNNISATINYSSSTVNGSGKSVSYTFNGWNITGMDNTTHTYGTTTTTNTSISSTKAIKYKNLRAKSGTVTFNAKWKAPTIILPKVTKTGYTCSWTSSGLTKASGASYTPLDEGGATERTFTASCTANTHTIEYALNNGSHGGTNHPGTATYNSQFTVDNPKKAIKLIFVNNVGATVKYNNSTVNNSGDSVSYTFAGWDITGMDSVTHTYGGSTTANTSISKTKATTFKNLRSTSGKVTFTANWTSPTITLPTVTKADHTCVWKSDNIADKASGGTFTPSSATERTFTASCTSNKPTVEKLPDWNATKYCTLHNGVASATGGSSIKECDEAISGTNCYTAGYNHWSWPLSTGKTIWADQKDTDTYSNMKISAINFSESSDGKDLNVTVKIDLWTGVTYEYGAKRYTCLKRNNKTFTNDSCTSTKDNKTNDWTPEMTKFSETYNYTIEDYASKKGKYSFKLWKQGWSTKCSTDIEEHRFSFQTDYLFEIK